MAITRNFAMSPEEFKAVMPLPRGCAWMSCHFSEDGLRDLPESLPEGSMLILDDSIPPKEICPEKILSQLTEAVSRLSCEAVLLDFQKPGCPGLIHLTDLLQKGLSCPVGVSLLYGKETDGPVFLPLLPAHKALKDWLAPWHGREMWLEVGPAPELATVTGKGTHFSVPSPPLASCPHRHEALNCHYGIRLKDSEILFTLCRTCDDLKHLTEEAESLGVTRTIGLYQELF